MTVVLLAASAFPLLTHRVHQGDGWGTVAPWSYAGPVSLVEQQFRAEQDGLRRIDVWAYVDGAPGEAAEIFARLMPEGSDRLRSARAAPRSVPSASATRRSPSTSQPIPDSGPGLLYTLAVGVLSGPNAATCFWA